MKITYKKAIKPGETDDGIRIDVEYDVSCAETAKRLASKLGAEFVSGTAAFGGLRSATVNIDGADQTWIGKRFA
jgi:hypothetical protein